MATQDDMFQKLEAELKSMQAVLTKYGDLFNANDFIDIDEQKQLNAMQAVIKKIEVRLAELKSKKQQKNATGKTAPKVLKKHKEKYKYGEVVAELFIKGKLDENKIDPNDVQQGELADCYFLAAIAAVARANPNALEKLIKENKDGTYDVTLYVYKNFLSWSRTPTVIQVKPEFPKDADGELVYANMGDKELWVMLLEKAYAKYRGNYNKIEYGHVEKAVGVLLGENATAYNVSRYTEQQILEIFTEALKKNQPIIADSKKMKKNKEAKDVNIVGNHSYPVKAVSDNNISLQNPWTNVNTEESEDNYDITISVSDFKKYFDDFNIKK